MNRYPNAAQKIIPAGASDPKITPVAVILHVDAGNSPSLFSWFNGPSGGIESHLFIKKDGTVEQYRQFDREADAQLGGNSWLDLTGRRLGAISVETQGRGPGWWTRAQKQAIKDLLLWTRDNLDIPLRVVTAPNPHGIKVGGVGYHSLFNDWNSLGKTCPGPRRIKWFRDHLVPWMREQNKAYVYAQDNDSWHKIADAHGITVSELVRLNRPETGTRVRIK